MLGRMGSVYSFIIYDRRHFVKAFSDFSVNFPTREGIGDAATDSIPDSGCMDGKTDQRAAERRASSAASSSSMAAGTRSPTCA